MTTTPTPASQPAPATCPFCGKSDGTHDRAFPHPSDGTGDGVAGATAGNAAPTEAVAIVDAGDDGLFIDFIYGEDGSPLKVGDKLYLASPAATAAPGDLPILPQSLLALIGEYGMARTDGLSEVNRIALWERLIAGIKECASNAGAAIPAAPLEAEYRLLDTRDTIEATDEWLSEDAVTWSVNPYRLFDGHAYCEAMLPARRRIAPSNNSPVGAQEKA